MIALSAASLLNAVSRKRLEIQAFSFTKRRTLSFEVKICKFLAFLTHYESKNSGGSTIRYFWIFVTSRKQPFKTRPSAKPFLSQGYNYTDFDNTSATSLQLAWQYCENEFYLCENKKNHFHINSSALRLALKQRLETTRKWPITYTAPKRRTSRWYAARDVMRKKGVSKRWLTSNGFRTTKKHQEL